MDNKGKSLEGRYGKGKRCDSLHSGEGIYFGEGKGRPFSVYEDDMAKLVVKKPNGNEVDSSTMAYVRKVFPQLFEEFSWRLLARIFFKSLITLLLLFAFWLLCQIFS